MYIGELDESIKKVWDSDVTYLRKLEPYVEKTEPVRGERGVRAVRAVCQFLD